MTRALLATALLVGCTTEGGDTAPAEVVLAEGEVPVSCLSALDYAEEVAGISAEFAGITSKSFGLAAQAIQAAGTFDTAGLRAVTRQMRGTNEEINALTARLNPVVDFYNAAAEDCRGNR